MDSFNRENIVMSVVQHVVKQRVRAILRGLDLYTPH